MTTFYFFGEVWSWQLYYVWFVQVWALPLPIWVVPPSLSPRQGRLCRMNDKIIRKFIQANNKTTRDFVVQKMTPELKELIRTWGLSESIEEEKSQQNYIEKHKSTGTNRKCSGLMGIGRQRRTIGTHLDSSGFPSHSLHLHCVPQIAQRTMPLFVFFLSNWISVGFTMNPQWRTQLWPMTGKVSSFKRIIPSFKHLAI